MDLQEVKAKAARYCAYQERCRKDLEDKLFQWNVKTPGSKKVLEELEKEGFFNDQRYARNYALGKFRNNKWGKIKIRLSLKQKDICERLIEDALQEISEEEYLEMIRSLMVRKLFSLSNTDFIAKKHKTAQFIIQKGFEPDLVWDMIKKLDD